jgi:predicted porin
MKKSLLALAVLGAFAGAASAQSSVTLFGVVDLSANSVKNGTKSAKYLASNQLNSNRLGFRGTEDLGGGMTAGFWLEAGMNNASGAAGAGSGNITPSDAANPQLFNRRSTVSLNGGFGEIRAGRDYDPSFWNTVFFDVNGANGIGEGLNLISSLGSGAGTVARTNNSIAYFLPGGLGGLYGQFQMAAAEGVTGAGYRGLRVGFASGPFDVAFATGSTKTATADNFKMTNFGGSFDAGVAKIYGFVNKNSYGAKKQSVWELSAGVPLGQGEFRVSFGKADASGAGTDANDASLLGFGYVYNLSKRTALYTSYGRISNKGAAAFTVLGGTLGSAAGATSSGYNFGVRHSF